MRAKFFVLLLLLLLSGCTLVEGGLQPRHFDFQEVIAWDGEGPGGWQAACVHVGIKRGGTGELFFCRFGVEMPITNEQQGFISRERAQSVAAKCANLAAKSTLRLTTKRTPLGMACEAFKTKYELIIRNTVAGAHVTRLCRPGLVPTVLTPP